MLTINKGRTARKENNMKTIAKYEELAKQKDKDKLTGISRDLYWGYFESKNAGADEINLNEIHRENEIEQIIKECHEYGIERITISSTYSGALTDVWEFVKRGCKVEGMKMVPLDSESYDYDAGKYVQRSKPALIIKIA